MKKNLDLLVAKSQQGDVAAFGKLYEHFFEKIYNYFYFRTWHQESAEDLTGLTFTKVLDKIQSYAAAKGSFSTWLFRIAHNNLIDHFRKNKPVLDIEDIWELPDDKLPDLDEENIFKWERIKILLTKLPPKTRDIIIMRIWDELSYGEIARILDKSESACKMAYSRGIKALRESFTQSLILLALYLVHQLKHGGHI